MSDTSTNSSFLQLHPKTKPTKKRSLEDIEDWDNHHTYMVLKKRKLQSQFDALKSEGMTTKSSIFEGVTIYVNGWTEPSAAELKEMVYEHGGKYEYNVYGRATNLTHTIASNLPNSKILKIGKSVVCRPEWIVDSVAANEKLPEEDYLLYKDLEGQTKLKLTASRVTSATSEENLKIQSPDAVSSERKVHVSPVGDSSLSKAQNCSDKADFVKEFFTHSRLHYLSTWSIELKQFLAGKLRSVTPRIPKLASSVSLRSSNSRAVVHIDLDCFFVSVNLKNNPHLRGKPVAVTHAKRNKRTETESASTDGDDTTFINDNGELAESNEPETNTNHMTHTSKHYPNLQDSTSDIASCSYEARAFDISNGMSVGVAMKKCPDLILLPYDFEAYREVSRQFYSILVQYSSLIEAVSCDEAYLEFTDYCRSYEQVVDLVRELRTEVACETGCTVSAGIAHNMLLARMSTRVAKPDGQFLLMEDQVSGFLSSQRVRDLPGVGRSTASKIQQEMGSIENCGELQAVPLTKLQATFGCKFGRILFDYCRGVDDRELKTSTERKSVSVDINFGIRFKELVEAETLIGNLAEELQRRSEEADVYGTQLTLKMKTKKQNAPRETAKYMGHGACNNVSRSMALLQPVRDTSECTRLAVKLLRQLKPVAEDIRGMGLQLSKLVCHATGDEGEGKTAMAQGQQQLKLVKQDPQSYLNTEVKRDNSSECPHPFPSLQHHQQLKKASDLPPKMVSPKGSKPRRRRRGSGISLANTKKSPMKQSPIKSPVRSLKSLRQYFKCVPQPKDSTSEAAGESHEISTVLATTTMATSKSPMKQSPIESPVRSPSKSLKQYFKRVPQAKDSASEAAGESHEISTLLATTAMATSIKAVRNLDDSFNIDLPPASQLDRGVLEALPVQLRERIMNRYNRSLNQDSSVEGRVPVDAGGINNYAKVSNGSTAGPRIALEEDSVRMEDEEVVISDEGTLVENWKKDIHEWTESFIEGPSDDDVMTVATHFCKMASTNLKIVEVCLKIFRRFLLSRKLCHWSTWFNALLEQVQEKVWLVYQGALKVEPLPCSENMSSIL